MGEPWESRTRPSSAARAAARRASRPPAPGNHPPYPARSTGPDRRSSAGRRWLRRFQVTVATLSVLTVLATGGVWTLYRDVTGGITTSNLLFGGSSGGEQNILLVGVDSRTDAQGNPLPDEILAELRSGAESGVLNSDTIILVHVPDDGGSATAFSIPRDSEVQIPGIGRNKVNAAYPQIKAQTASRLSGEGVTDPKRIDQESSQAGRQALIETVQNLTGLGIDHYAEVNLLGFYNLTQAIGGVEVCLKAPVSDTFSGADFPAGPQTISGGDALAFVRQRHGLAGGDLSRINRQQVFLASVANKVLSSGTLTDPAKLGALIDVVQQAVVIDSGWEILAFAREASQIAAGKMDFLTIPTGGPEDSSSGDVLGVDPRQVQDFVARHTEPPEDPAPAAEESDAGAAPPPTPVVADVGNGSGTTGLAAQVAGTLGQNGITPGAVGNAPDRTTSVVRYSQADGDAAARRVAEALGGIGVEQSDAVGQGRVQVLIGTDFDQQGGGGSAAGGGGAPASSGAPSTPPITAGGVPCID
ncbi:Cell envelope-associated transcriptional attenuator LytR-CpsA-Psr, subfamily A1 [Pseudonocardia sp. Ae168_Ps1]|uniref:LCP family protein n=1 Tax=unclassified Pseudonocardia TaxID=2619320 RepID=UPI00096A12B2|nr:MULTISPECIES: LCP family protein [unclassified Pseudonocardia]OLL73959.1 Cell envelope-associated transcriptional attenuator LytR-CpsA-Psr, subfamily A1 [Pseudonocardia sp. Ae150A_Ps1]OLL79937.1 Cell envelope-associated transcriptional attenuator LytR-CpsA-Psr, subfamily A1 [Pseudonocardia sp. Ae168_Ps1]OLL85929.1 Cell envelope-associated transcriptional attenuator LytR-CpsA-Psr, subfamily A1 [Pseudonocardia sp. Ae263_Ps1]OLL94040.1 Cell envelope-associated transcriptional attenuator LytR-Cp